MKLGDPIPEHWTPRDYAVACKRGMLEELLAIRRRGEETFPLLRRFDEGTLPSISDDEDPGEWLTRCCATIVAHTSQDIADTNARMHAFEMAMLLKPTSGRA